MAETKPANSCPTCALLSLHPKEPQTKRTARVEELLRRNSPPLDVELADFRLVVDRAPEILQDLDEKIVLAREMLDTLVRARSQAESHLADAKSLIHPGARSLPYDVVAEIFSHCVYTWDMNTENHESVNSHAAPWTLTHVCFRWRHIALSLPNLWTHIGLNFDSLDKDTSRQMYKLGLLVERSKCLPLSVDLHSSREINDHPFLPILVVTIPRWKQLAIGIPKMSLQSFSGNVFSSLKTLVLDFNPDDDSEFDVTTFSLPNVPVLRAFNMMSCTTWKWLEHVHLPWSKLVRAIDVPSDDIHVYNYLEKMSKLEELSVKIGSRSWDASVSLPILLQLTLREDRWPYRYSDSKELQKCFSTLDIPSLSHLSLFFQSRKDEIHYFPQLQTGMKQTLVNLYISCTTSHTDHVQNLLRFLLDTPCVETFCIVDEAMSIDFISALKVSPVSSPLLPCLRKLDISDCFCDKALGQDRSVIYDMLESRYAPSPSTSSTVNITTLLETVSVPRWLYFGEDDRWKDICRDLKVECGRTMRDDKDDSDNEQSDNASTDESSDDVFSDEQSDDSEHSDSEGW